MFFGGFVTLSPHFFYVYCTHLIMSFVFDEWANFSVFDLTLENEYTFGKKRVGKTYLN